MAGEPKTDTALPIYGDAALAHACWSCGDMRAAHFCESCGKLQPAQPADYFTFFGLPRKLHPDLYVTSQGPERGWSLEKSSQLNDAYRTLRDPISRTEYLLRLEGVQLEEQSKAATDKARATGQEKKQVVPPDLLEEVFELNMQLEEFRGNKKLGEDDPGLRQQIEATRTDLEQKLAATDGELRKLWGEWDALIDRNESQPSEAGRVRVRDAMLALLNRRKYIANLVRDVKSELDL